MSDYFALAETVGPASAGKPVLVDATMVDGGAQVRAFTVGALEPQPTDGLSRAVTVAENADAVVLVVGDVLETSRESRDLGTSALPDDQIELIRQATEANPRTVVVVNAGRPVAAPWAEQTAALLYAWFPGQEFGPALAAVLAGDKEPGGRLPFVIPARDEDRSTWADDLDEDLSLDYSHAEPTGYRHLQRVGIAPRFAFGTGRGYTSFSVDTAELEESPGADVQLVVSVTNTGGRWGREVVQVYVSAPGETDSTLAGFAGVEAEPGETVEVAMAIRSDAFRRWSTQASAWCLPAGDHTLHVGRSSVDIGKILTVPR